MSKRLTMIGAGYALAVALGYVVVYLNERTIPPDASDGMAAFGDLVLFVAVTGLVGLVPTWWLLRLVFRR